MKISTIPTKRPVAIAIVLVVAEVDHFWDSVKRPWCQWYDVGNFEQVFYRKYSTGWMSKVQQDFIHLTQRNMAVAEMR